MVVSHFIVMPTVEYAFAPRHQKLYANNRKINLRLRYRQLLLKCRFAPLGKSFRYLKTPSRHVLKHTITTAFLLKNGTPIKPVIARLFRAMGITAFSEKSYHKKVPHRPTKNNNQIRAFCVQKFVRLKSPVLARLSDGSGAAQFALKHRGELLSPQARKTFLRAPLSQKERKRRTQLQSTAKEYRRYFHLYSRIITYLFRFVNKIRTNVCILSWKHFFKAFEPCMDGAESVVVDVTFRFFS